MEVTTKITSLFDEDAQDLMTDKMYPLYSDDELPIVRESEAAEIIRVFFNLKLNRYYDCILKAKIVANCYGIKTIHLGTLMVESTEDGVMYGYTYNPPLELHAWVQFSKSHIIDFALAGTIEKGLKTKDSIGPFLINREPVILAGVPATWMHYTTHEIVLVENVRSLDVETAKELIKIWK